MPLKPVLKALWGDSSGVVRIPGRTVWKVATSTATDEWVIVPDEDKARWTYHEA
jgi:hypothetical protein